MFTGLVQVVASVLSTRSTSSGCELVVAHTLGPLALGESICVNGCCLSVVNAEDDPRGSAAGAGRFWADVTHETLGRTTLGQLEPGDRVNLERSLRPTDLLGGHLVTGHVDAVARVAELEQVGDSQRVSFDVHESLQRMVAPRGSVTVNGVSLTVCEASRNRFSVMLIPHTRAVTTLGQLSRGSEVNVEVDVIARYVAHALAVGAGARDEASNETPLIATLKKAGLL